VPFVEDRRNTLVFSVAESADEPTLASLHYALKRGVEARFQVENGELGVELLPSGGAPAAILFYEAAEGGAGVLSRLVQEPGALAEVARAALEACHFDPESGEDRRRAAGASEDCEAACYNCLLGYTNQRDHRLLDRHLVRDLLLDLTGVRARAGAGGRTRAELRDELLARCQSELERRFVRFLDEGGYRLPDRAQPLLAAFGTRPDFFYEEAGTCVYVDGPYHEFPERQARDAALTSSLEDGGVGVIRVQGDHTWPAVVDRYAWIFGEGDR
jgi:hypothetical protein